LFFCSHFLLVLSVASPCCNSCWQVTAALENVNQDVDPHPTHYGVLEHDPMHEEVGLQVMWPYDGEDNAMREKLCKYKERPHVDGAGPYGLKANTLALCDQYATIPGGLDVAYHLLAEGAEETTKKLRGQLKALETALTDGSAPRFMVRAGTVICFHQGSRIHAAPANTHICALTGAKRRYTVYVNTCPNVVHAQWSVARRCSSDYAYGFAVPHRAAHFRSGWTRRLSSHFQLARPPCSGQTHSYRATRRRNPRPRPPGNDPCALLRRPSVAPACPRPRPLVQLPARPARPRPRPLP